MKYMLLFGVLIANVLSADPYNVTELAKIKNSDHNQTQFSFVVMRDNRDGDAIFKKIIAQTNTEHNLSFAINNDDLVPHDREEQYARYYAMIRSSTHPILSIIGNHKIPLHGKKRYKAMFGPSSFCFAYPLLPSGRLAANPLHHHRWGRCTSQA